MKSTIKTTFFAGAIFFSLSVDNIEDMQKLTGIASLDSSWKGNTSTSQELVVFQATANATTVIAFYAIVMGRMERPNTVSLE